MSYSEWADALAGLKESLGIRERRPPEPEEIEALQHRMGPSKSIRNGA